jgi:hypothetical protein
MARRPARIALAVGIIGMSAFVFAGRAEAACHSWTVTGSPSTVAEGGKVTVTVTRDGAVNPSDVHVTTIDGTAKAPGDYTKLDAHVQLTSETSKTYTIAIKDDTITEGAETFKVHLHNPGGCQVHPDYQLGPDAVVTIKASDPATPKPAPPAPIATQAAQPTAMSTTTPTPTVSPSTGPTGSPQATLAPQATPKSSGGLGAGAIAGIVIGAVALAGGLGVILYRRRVA